MPRRRHGGAPRLSTPPHGLRGSTSARPTSAPARHRGPVRDRASPAQSRRGIVVAPSTSISYRPTVRSIRASADRTTGRTSTTASESASWYVRLMLRPTPVWASSAMSFGVANRPPWSICGVPGANTWMSRLMSWAAAPVDRGKARQEAHAAERSGEGNPLHRAEPGEVTRKRIDVDDQVQLVAHRRERIGHLAGRYPVA